MSATARAEARRKAILSRGTDRLAKLTTSARGEDAPAYLHDDPPLPATGTRNFLGEDSSDMPSVRPSSTPSFQPTRGSTITPRGSTLFDGSSQDPSTWNAERQQDFIQALINDANSGSLPRNPNSIAGSDSTLHPDPAMAPMDNPFAALLASQLNGGAASGQPGSLFPAMGPGMGGKFPDMAMQPPKEKTRLQKVLPLLHLVSMWCLLAYFVLWVEPSTHTEVSGQDAWGNTVDLWRRWARLGQDSNSMLAVIDVFKVNLVPFFWAFTTLQIALHSLRIFAGFDAVQPPTLLALALPSLPPPLPSIIMNGLKYMQMGSLFLDDLAGLVVGLGFIIYFSGWLAQSQS